MTATDVDSDDLNYSIWLGGRISHHFEINATKSKSLSFKNGAGL